MQFLLFYIHARFPLNALVKPFYILSLLTPVENFNVTLRLLQSYRSSINVNIEWFIANVIYIFFGVNIFDLSSNPMIKSRKDWLLTLIGRIDVPVRYEWVIIGDTRGEYYCT